MVENKLERAYNTTYCFLNRYKNNGFQQNMLLKHSHRLAAHRQFYKCLPSVRTKASFQCTPTSPDEFVTKSMGEVITKITDNQCSFLSSLVDAAKQTEQDVIVDYNARIVIIVLVVFVWVLLGKK